MAIIDVVRKYIHIKYDLIRCLICEFFCTTMLIFCGCSVSAQAVLSRSTVTDWDGLTIGWGLSILLAVMLGYRISAVSFFMFTFGRISFIRFLLYSVVQVAGGFVGSFFTYVFYYDSISAFDGGRREMFGPHGTASIFATYPAPYQSTRGAFVAETLGTSLLAIGIGAISEPRNAIPIFLQPLFIALLVTLLGAAHGMNPGFAYNPARDLGPRLFSLVAGYDWTVLSIRNYMWLCVPIAGPMIGALVGAWLYQLLIGAQIVERDETTQQPPSIHRVLRELTQNELRMIQMCIDRMIGMQATPELPLHRGNSRKTDDMNGFYNNKIWIDAN